MKSPLVRLLFVRFLRDENRNPARVFRDTRPGLARNGMAAAEERHLGMCIVDQGRKLWT